MDAALASVCCVCGCAVDLHAPHAILKHDYAHLDCADVYDSRDLGALEPPDRFGAGDQDYADAVGIKRSGEL